MSRISKWFREIKNRKHQNSLVDANDIYNNNVYGDNDGYEMQFGQPIVDPSVTKPDERADEVYPTSAVKPRHVTNVSLSERYLQTDGQPFRKDEEEADLTGGELTSEKPKKEIRKPVQRFLRKSSVDRRKRQVNLRRCPEYKSVIFYGISTVVCAVTAVWLFKTYESWMDEVFFNFYEGFKQTAYEKADINDSSSATVWQMYSENPRGGGDKEMVLYSPNCENIPDDAIVGTITDRGTNVQGLETFRINVEKNGDIFARKSTPGETINIKQYDPNGDEVELHHNPTSQFMEYGSYALGFVSTITGYRAVKNWREFKKWKRQKKKQSLPQKI
jgi:hypothetical protein